LSDCHSGIVINGLESVYSQSQPSTLQVVLKAFSNRKHIYVLNLSDTYDALKERDRQQREAEEALQKEIAEREERWQWELDQEMFDALPDEDKEKITQRHLEAFRQKKRRALEQKAKEEEERRQQEENHRLKEKELKKKKKKDEKSATLEVPRMKTSLEIKQSIVDELQCEFDKYEQSQAMVEQVLQQWDRVQGVLLDYFPAEELRPGSDDAIIEKKAASTKKSKKSTTKAVQRALDLIPHIVRNVTQNGCGSSTELLNNSILPTLDEILNDLSLGHGGPPSRPPTTLSVVAFPEHREQPKVHQTCFTFLNPSGHDEDDENKDLEEHAHKTIAQEKPTGSKRHKGNPDHKTKDKKGKESHMSITRQSKTKSKGSESLTTFRWVVPANSEVLLKIWFYSESPGIFKQVFNFELAGNHKLYQLTCRGVCTYPSISKEFKTLFAHSKKVAQKKEGLQKTYVIKPGYFEFGPLLCSKTRDRYKKNTYPENSVRLVIHNNSSLEAEVQFSFQHDTQATTYLLDPPTMALTPGQKEVLTVWAFPTKQGQIKDSLICHIKDNPEPTVIQFSCWGVRPELELEMSHLSFGRILLHRTCLYSACLL
ncbi:hypothetical protein ATANTOWER_007134, partial [Ataeniobius toweri]|nr:hypothetical protein [Ataeniobius toweri]